MSSVFFSAQMLSDLLVFQISSNYFCDFSPPSPYFDSSILRKQIMSVYPIYTSHDFIYFDQAPLSLQHFRENNAGLSKLSV